MRADAAPLAPMKLGKVRSTEAVFWCVRDCSQLEAIASVAPGYYSSVQEASIGAFLKTSRIGSSV